MAAAPNQELGVPPLTADRTKLDISSTAVHVVMAMRSNMSML